MKELIQRLFKRQKYGADYLLSLSVSIIAALLLGAVIMLLTGFDPIRGYGELLKGAFGSARVFGNTLAKTVTLCITGLAMATAAKAGMFNVGGEGQLYLGAMAAAVIGFALPGLPAAAGIAAAILAAVAAGGLYALIPALLKVKLKVNEVITTIMLNSAAIYFCVYLANGPFKTAETGIASGTPSIDAAYRFKSLVPLSNLTGSIFIAAAVAFLVWYVMSKTAWGYEAKLTGQNPRFAFYSGIKTDRLAIISMVASGMMCGLVGMFEVYGIHGRFVESVSAGFYFDGMLVAMIMRYDPIGIIFMSLFFAALRIGGSAMELNVGVSSELILVIQSIIIFFMAAENGIAENIKAKRARKLARLRIEKGENP
jgi:simple sugar transport system permease protein